MAQTVNIQVRWQVIRLEDFLEAPCEGRWSKEAQKEKEKCESGQDLTEEICAVAEAVIPTKNIRDKASLSRIFVFVLCA